MELLEQEVQQVERQGKTIQEEVMVSVGLLMFGVLVILVLGLLLVGNLVEMEVTQVQAHLITRHGVKVEMVDRLSDKIIGEVVQVLEKEL